MTKLAMVMVLPCVVLGIAAFALAYNHIAGWGWFLFGAIICSGVSIKSGKNEAK